MKKLKTATIGVGYLGKFHAEKLAHLPNSELIAVCDIDKIACSKIAQAYNVTAVEDYRSLVGQIEAVTIATPTRLHYEIACFFLNNGIHVLVEKPISNSIEEADAMIAAARNNNVLLQVGHLERFNNTILAIKPALHNPRFIECIRSAPFKQRGTDINVVLDLMIHDIDIIQSVVQAKICKIAANGASVLSSCLDIANARIEFANGCVASVTASRVSCDVERKLRIFQHDSYLNVDLNKKKIDICRISKKSIASDHPVTSNETHLLDKGDALEAEIDAFLDCIQNNKPSPVSGEMGKQAIATAIEITRIIKSQS